MARASSVRSKMAKADVTLSDGRELTIDLNRVTISEYRALFKTDQPDEEEYAILAKVCGVETAEIAALGYIDWKRTWQAFFKKAQEPLADPNSPSASTST